MISLKGNDGDRKKRVGNKDGVASSMHGQCRLRWTEKGNATFGGRTHSYWTLVWWE
jgi:hypothetical protein